jgi:hypothetical protein|tara:strand:- start:800 stop:2077 length:1278 start_codon:yes stop_codon:yes gene_type:complete
MQLLPLELELHASEDRFINELKMAKPIVRKLKAVWTTLKSKIKGSFKKKLKKLELFEPTVIEIPAQIKEDIIMNGFNINEGSGALGAIKGNYNEALVCQFIFDYNGPQVNISKDYEKYRSGISKTVSDWDKKLKLALKPKDYTNALKIIRKGSADMANYLISNTVLEQATIIGCYLDNLAFQDGIDFKADIRVAVMKEGKEILDGYSLKLYSSKSVGLANTTARGLCKHLAGESAASDFDSIFNKDSELRELIKVANDLDKIKQDHKEHLRGDEKATARLTRLRGLTDAQIENLDQTKIESDRKKAREPINPRVAAIVYKVLKPHAKNVDFASNILKIMGFQDKETKLLMAITTTKKNEIIKHHPDLDMDNITLEDPKGRVTLNIKGSTGKTIVTFGVKEGEKKSVSGSVSFAGIEPEDYDEYLK